MAEPAPVKIAILGGGLGGLTAAYELTRPEHEGRFAVTVYQLGWRLGGKGASGRNADRGQRIEEHGLHIWFGFYANAFRMMREVYEALGRDVATAFAPCDVIALFDRIDGEWQSVAGRFPVRGDDPWNDEPERLPAAIELTRIALGWAIDCVQGVPGTEAPEARERLEEALVIAHTEGLVDEVLRRVVAKVRDARDALLRAWRERLEGDVRARLVYTTLDAFLAAATGVVRDGVLRDGWQAVDDRDWAKWLADNGASELTIGDTFPERSPALRSVYDVAFSFPGGDVLKASAAAGTATSDLLRLALTYRGHFAYKMTAGMGDVIFAPLYELLKEQRGVEFKLFHAVTGLHAAEDGSAVERIDVLPQVAEELEYDPLVHVKGLPCWPHLPKPDRMPRPAVPLGRRFETEHDPLRRGRPLVLERGRDFDHAVLAIPVGALEQIAGDLMAKDDDFAAMVKGSHTVQTQAFQLWTRRPASEMGARYGRDAVAATFVEPLDTYCDMGQTLDAEDWPAGHEVRGVTYVCGVLKDGPPAQGHGQVERNMEEYIARDLPHLWPDADDPAREVTERYWRANVAPWERYVITPADSVRHRLPSDRSGFENLVLAGDWTLNGINGGCVEAAVISGLRAAKALLGDDGAILGEDPKWLTPE